VTALELSRELGLSRSQLFKLRARYPAEERLNSFSDLPAWRLFIERAKTDIRTTTPLPKSSGNGKLPSAIESNIAFVHARAKEKAAAAELRELQLAATKRSIVHAEEIQLLFGRIAAITRMRILKAAADLPCLLAGLDAPSIDRIVQTKLEEALSSLALPVDFFDPRGVISSNGN
jgi:hypothetical protein